MCTYKDCAQSAKTYGSKALWWEHETSRHRRKHAWVCRPCEQEQNRSIFDTSLSFEEHLDTRHATKLTTFQLQKIRDMCHKDMGRLHPRTNCPLCQESITYNGRSRALERAVRKHVADHLEQLALFVALPAGQMLLEEDISEFQDDSDSENGLQSEIGSIMSKETNLSKKEIQFTNVKTFIADQQKVKSNTTTTALAQIPIAQLNQVRYKTVYDHGGLVFPLHVQVPPLSEHFYCRQNTLAEVDRVLHSQGTICVVYGFGGVGKTLAAVQYLHTYKKRYDAIIWLQADTAPGLAESFLQMVIALGIGNSTDDHHHVIAKGREWLQETGMLWRLPPIART